MPLGHGQLRRRRPGRPGPHRQAQAEEDPVPAPSDRRLPRRDRPDHRTLVTTCSTSSTWLAGCSPGWSVCQVPMHAIAAVAEAASATLQLAWKAWSLTRGAAKSLLFEKVAR